MFKSISKDGDKSIWTLSEKMENGILAGKDVRIFLKRFIFHFALKSPFSIKIYLPL